MHITPAHGVAQAIKDFDEKFPIGTEVIYQGEVTRTWSHAGRGAGQTSWRTWRVY